MGRFLFPTRPTGEAWFCPRETTRFLCNLRAGRRQLLSAKPAALSWRLSFPVWCLRKTPRRQQIGPSPRSRRLVCQHAASGRSRFSVLLCAAEAADAGFGKGEIGSDPRFSAGQVDFMRKRTSRRSPLPQFVRHEFPICYQGLEVISVSLRAAPQFIGEYDCLGDFSH
jgi:hypothetical protein